MAGIEWLRGSTGGPARRGPAWRSRAGLSRADLSRASLAGADFTRTKLDHADLEGADLRYANLRDTTLAGARMACADLNMVTLRRGDLRDADLSHASLRHTNLADAKLYGADLAQAVLEGTTFGRNDLRATRGLQAKVHEGPSTIGTNTMALSNGAIPEAFLRGCGLADWEIAAAKLYNPELSPAEITDIQYRIFELRASRPIQFFSVFISHSHADKTFAHQLFDALQDKGVRCWLDEHQLLPGDRILDRIDHGIKHWDKVILCCSKSALENSWWVADEVNRALNKERAIQKEEGRKVDALVPLTIDKHVYAWKDALADIVRSRKIADFTGWRDGEALPAEPLHQLIRALHLGDRGREPPPPKRL